ncbi:hypothetical protein A1O1_04702 [Capronia coronata CBS 617.96]|uniref:Uncharacterized protein n=1 Tax=Capronia coronata CBS 617.96 TaxID=1182541 RepID=W9YDL7_9EURO|nr:uncharacterized protein A1O1_04702 [Capronia coronata CBS 617.96]EXJ87775.1 hypothetical protein A1O1_04702 [Capronia coronata CBS 617.96]
MSSESLAAFRKHAGDDLGKLAEEHMKHDLRDSDRDILQRAATKASRHALIGSLAGIALGGFLAFRLRANRNAMYQALRTAEKPTHVRFADGREEAIPDITPLLKPTPLGDIMTYTFFGIGGLFLGGETGFLTGMWAAKRTVSADPEAKRRIEKAFRSFRADVMKKQIEDLEGGDSDSSKEILWT